MPFKRGHWRCAVRGCPHDGELSLAVVVSTGGHRTERLQVCAPAVRVCMTDAKEIAGGKMVAALADSIKTAIGRITSGQCRPAKRNK